MTQSLGQFLTTYYLRQENKMTKTYEVTFEHTFVIKTDDIQEVLLNYEFPDFTDCKSIVGEPEFDSSIVNYQESSEELVA
jgi:hypothetical protein